MKCSEVLRFVHSDEIEAQRPVQHGYCLIEPLEAIQQLLLLYDERRGAVDVRVAVQTDQAVVTKRRPVRGERFVGSLVLQLRVAPVSVLDVKAAEQTNRAELFDARVLVGEVLHAGLEQRRHALDAPHDIVAQNVLDCLVRHRHGDGVRLVRRAVPQRLVVEESHDFVRASRHTQRDRCSRDSLGGGHDVWHNPVVVLKTEELAGPAKANHDFVYVQENAVLVTNRTDALHVPIGHGQDAPRPHDATNGDRQTKQWMSLSSLNHLQSERSLRRTFP